MSFDTVIYKGWIDPKHMETSRLIEKEAAVTQYIPFLTAFASFSTFKGVFNEGHPSSFNSRKDKNSQC